MLVGRIEFKQTCSGCPEQYDAYIGGKQVGYLRLRHGDFSVECPDVFKELVYSYTYPELIGEFLSDEDRKLQLTHAANCIETWVGRVKYLDLENGL